MNDSYLRLVRRALPPMQPASQWVAVFYDDAPWSVEPPLCVGPFDDPDSATWWAERHMTLDETLAMFEVRPLVAPD